MKPDEIKALCERLRDEATELQRTAWHRLDGGQDCSLNSILADQAATALETLSTDIARITAERDAAVAEVERRVKEERELCARTVEHINPLPPPGFKHLPARLTWREPGREDFAAAIRARNTEVASG